MTDVYPSLRHVPKLAEVPDVGEPIYRCHLCGRHGAREKLAEKECPKRSGVMRRMAGPDSTPTKKTETMRILNSNRIASGVPFSVSPDSTSQPHNLQRVPD